MDIVILGHSDEWIADNEIGFEWLKCWLLHYLVRSWCIASIFIPVWVDLTIFISWKIQQLIRFYNFPPDYHLTGQKQTKFKKWEWKLLYKVNI